MYKACQETNSKKHWFMRHACAQPCAKEKEMLPPEEVKCKVLLSIAGRQQHLGGAPHQLGTPGHGLLGVCKDPISKYRSAQQLPQRKETKARTCNKKYLFPIPEMSSSKPVHTFEDPVVK